MPDAVPPRHSPPPLVVAASLAALEGTALVVGGVLELFHIGSGSVSLAISLAVFFVAYGALLLAGAVGLYRVVAWPRGPVLISQLILLGLAWGLRDHIGAALVMAVVAVVTFAGLVHPASIEVLERARTGGEDEDQASGSSD